MFYGNGKINNKPPSDKEQAGKSFDRYNLYNKFSQRNE